MKKRKETYCWCRRKVVKVHDFFRYDIKYGVRNLVRWFPIIWHDRNWDHYYIFTMLRKKLIHTEDCIRYGHHDMSVKSEADRIKTCVLLIDRIIKDEYYELTDKGYKHQDYLHNQDIEMLFKIMNKRILGWWD